MYQSIYREKGLSTAGAILLGKVVGGTPSPTPKHPDIRWVTAEELFKMAERGEFWNKYQPLVVSDYLRRGSYPLELVSVTYY